MGEECSDTHIGRSQEHSSRCLVKAEDNLFEYKQGALLETIVICFCRMLSFPK